MASQLRGKTTTGTSNVKAVLIRLSDGFYWNTSGTPAFEAYNASNIASYGIAMTEAGATGNYSVTNPSDSTLCEYFCVACAGASMTVADLATNTFWEGTAGPGATVSVTDSVWSASPASFATAGTMGFLQSAGVSVYGTVTGQISTSSFQTDVSYPDNTFNDQLLVFYGGSANLESRPIVGYLNANGVFTFDEVFTTAPTVGSLFYILPTHTHPISQIVSAMLTTVMTESYNADGSPPTLAQALYVVMQRLTDFAINGTTISVKKIDGTTQAYPLTINSATAPTSSTRS